jgi:hypothetical protein
MGHEKCRVYQGRNGEISGIDNAINNKEMPKEGKIKSKTKSKKRSILWLKSTRNS